VYSGHGGKAENICPYDEMEVPGQLHNWLPYFVTLRVSLDVAVKRYVFALLVSRPQSVQPVINSAHMCRWNLL
jgi:hypothetical protein